MWYDYYMPNLYTAKEYLDTLDSFVEVQKKAREPRLPVTILVSEGERLEQVFMYKQLQYEPIIVPTIPYTERSDASLLNDSDDGGNYIPEELHHGEAYGLKEKIRSLRMSWMLALDLMPICRNDLKGNIVCERRAVPMVDAKLLYTAIKKVVTEYPDTDVIRLFHTHTYDRYKLEELDYDKECITELPDNVSEELPAGKERTRLSPYCDGTYAMFVSSDSRRKVSELFRTTRMPVDTALEYAAATGKLKVRTLSFNAFVRAGGPKEKVDGYRYCVQLSSYNRPMQLLSQIISLKDQLRYVKDTSRLTVHIVVRGCDRITYDIIKDRADLELDSVKHKVTSLPNRSQVINFIEVPEGYDFYLKMDDDDFYDPLYLFSTMSYHDRLPSDICSTLSGISMGVAVCMRDESQDRSIVRYDKTGACENTLVFPAVMIDHIIRLSASTTVYTTSGKATDAIPMRTLSHSKLGLNRYEYWRFMSILSGRNNSVFSVLNYEGSAHATGKSNFGAFAATAGPGAAEYYVRVFDVLESIVGGDMLSTIRESFSKYKGVDVAIVTDAPGAETGMYIPMNTKWCCAEVSAAQAIKDITYDNNFVTGFTFCRTGNRYVYEQPRGLMVPEDAYKKWEKLGTENSVPEFRDWFLSRIIKPGDKDALN